MSLSTISITVLIAGILNAILGVTVLIPAPKRKLNFVFSLCAFIMSFWALELFMFQMRVGPSTDFWIRVGYLTVWLMSIFFVYFSFIFPFEKYYRLSKITIIFFWLLLLIYFYFLFFTNKFIVDVVDHATWTEVVLGPVHIFFQIGSAFSYTVFGRNIFWKLKRTKGLERIQLQLFLAGVFIYSIPVVILTVILPTFFRNTRYFVLSPVTSFIFTSFVVYAIFKYRFLGIKFILGKFLYYVLVALVPFTSFYLIFFLQTRIWGSIFSTGAILSGIGIAFVYIVIFRKLDDFIRNFLEKSLIYADTDPHEVIKELENIIKSGLDLEKIVSKVISLIQKTFDVDRVGIVLLGKGREKVTLDNLSNFERLSDKDSSVLIRIELSKEVLVYDEIVARGKYKADKMLNKVIELMKQLGIAVLVPMKMRDKSSSFLLIGPRKNKEAYTVQDIDLLENIASTLSVVVRDFIITTEDVNLALRNFSSPHLLKGSNLLRLRQVQKLSEEKRISKVDALKEILASVIEYFKPEKDKRRRTAARLKYEILRMIAYEGATESQIMWDLGFDVYTRSVEEKISEGAKPRFPLKSAGEYAATSDRSFKRLKKEAVEMLKWKVEEGEKSL